MGTFERGFKTWADRTALAMRRAVGLLPHQPLEPRRLARHLGVVMLTPSEVPGLTPDALRQLLEVDPDGWSAVSCRAGDTTIVIFNPAHPVRRQSNDIMHELAHVILSHTSSKLIVSQDGGLVMRTYSEAEERAADWLAGALLLPREALLYIARKFTDVEGACSEYVVSRPLLDWRMNVTGVRRQLQRRGRFASIRGRSS